MTMDVNFLGNSSYIGFSDEPPVKGATFTPSVSDDGVISWANDHNLPNPAPVNIKGEKGAQGERGLQGVPGADGKDGVTFIPSVSVNGMLSWENDQGLQNPEPVDIKGKNGKTPEVYVDPIEGGHRIMIYTEGAQETPTFFVMDGADGETPVKGEDYWTEADKAEMLAETGEQWQLLCDTTTTEEIAEFGISLDMDGNWLSCRKIAAQMIMPTVMGITLQFAFGNALTLDGGEPAMIVNPKWNSGKIFDFQIELVKNQFAVFNFNQRATKSFMPQLGNDGCISTLGVAETSALTKFFIANTYTENPFPVGTRILIWGCKA